VVADRLVLRDAVANLVDNAIKYGPAASTIAVTVNGDATHAVLSVTDQGPGISVEHRSRIFDRFYRVDEGRSRDMGGTGLGLAIAKWAVEANGGQITLDSTERGATFRIVLPRAA
jgi:signal transduction histidine kinase